MTEKKAENVHTSVLLAEALTMLDAERAGTFVDATLGMGGHTESILRSNPRNYVIGLDQDEKAIELAETRLHEFRPRFRIVHANFVTIKRVVEEGGGEPVDGILADLGASSLQLDSPERGFSFRFDAPLDMRMNPADDVPTAADLLATLKEEEIANLIYRFGEERFSRRIARRIVENRKAGKPVRTTGELVRIVESSVRRSPKDKIHPATRTFQALRIAVNRETDVLEQFLYDAVEVLKIEGRLVIITFHSLEDRIVKQAFQKMSGKCLCPPRLPRCECGARKVIEILTRKPVVPTDEEMANNPRSRSAKLRAARKISN
jgi:16S rRNA (cytosine1402-N4)-methyltransferase